MATKLLQTLQDTVTELQTTNSIISKRDILRKKPELKGLLYSIYNPYFQHYVSSKQVDKKKSLVDNPPTYTELDTLLAALRSRKLTGHAAISAVNGFISIYPEHRELIGCILDKDLKGRINSSIINSVWKDLIPTFDVSLAHLYKNVSIDFENEEWYASRKMDGLRLITRVDGEGNCTFFSRTGKELFSLGVLNTTIHELGVTNTVFDGELCSIDENGNEDFSAIVKLVHKKDFTIPNPHYMLFDMLTTTEFDNRKSVGNVLNSRMASLKALIPDKHPYLGRVQQQRMHSADQVDIFHQMAIGMGWEGLILRKNTEYEGKRSNNMLKVKQFFDSEFEVKRLENHDITVTDGQTQVTETMLGTVEIEYKGEVVRVGSGFSLQQRRLYFKHPERLLGTTITVQYFAESTDQFGKLSLRFPTVKAIYENGRDV